MNEASEQAQEALRKEEEQKRGIRRTALLLGAIAFAFYVGFIAVNAYFR